MWSIACLPAPSSCEVWDAVIGSRMFSLALGCSSWVQDALLNT